MPDFIAVEGGFVALSSVARIVKAPQGKAAIRLEDDGHALSEAPYEEVVADLGPVISDSTGAKGIRLVIDDLYDDASPTEEAVLVYEYPILAWRISPTGAVPILPLGVEPTHIQYADGTVQSMIGDEFGDLKTAVKEFIAHAG